MVAPVPTQISKLPPRLPVAALRRPLPTLPTTHYLPPTTPLCALCAPHSMPSVLRFSPCSGAQARQRPPTAHYPPLTTHSPLTTFRMNTCKSVSKQSTLTTFRMNTYVKRGEGGTLQAAGLVTRSQTHAESRDAWNGLAAKGHLRETFLGPPSYINASTCREPIRKLASSKARSGKEKFRYERSSLPTH
jgi:hypothetical protein